MTNERLMFPGKVNDVTAEIIVGRDYFGWADRMLRRLSVPTSVIVRVVDGDVWEEVQRRAQEKVDKLMFYQFTEETEIEEEKDKVNSGVYGRLSGYNEHVVNNNSFHPENLYLLGNVIADYARRGILLREESFDLLPVSIREINWDRMLRRAV